MGQWSQVTGHGSPDARLCEHRDAGPEGVGRRRVPVEEQCVEMEIGGTHAQEVGAGVRQRRRQQARLLHAVSYVSRATDRGGCVGMMRG